MSESQSRVSPQAPAEPADNATPANATRSEPRPAVARLIDAQALPSAEPLPPAGAAPSSGPTPGHTPGHTPGPWPTPLLDPAALRSNDPEMRLRDLLVFGYAAEAGTAAPDIPALRLRAEGELNAFAYRLLHNRVEEIRREAMQEQIAGMRPTLGFATLVAANALGLVAAGLAGALLWLMFAGMGGR